MTITAQAVWSQSEQPTVDDGYWSREEGQPITANPHAAVCQQSLRDHWLWDEGWYRADKLFSERIAPP
jgi:hypothetical protein